MSGYYHRRRPNYYPSFSIGGYSTRYSSRYNRFRNRSSTSHDSSPYWNVNYYGRRRRRRNFWERDRAINNRFRRNRRSRWRTDPDTPPREESPEPKPPPRPEPKPEPPQDIPKPPLTVKDINLNIKENTEKHHTDVYECTKDDREKDEDGNEQPAELVVRRGEFMKLTVTFDQPYEKKKHDLRVCLTIGEIPKPTKGTSVQFKIDEDGKQNYEADKWGAYLEKCSGNDIDIMVHIAANSIIGEWNLSLISVSPGEKKNNVLKYEHDEDVIILFNPWCKDDGVYMETTTLLDEYILNEDGCVYTGNETARGAKPWNFGTFEDGILDICLYLIRAKLKNGITKDLADPILVSRLIAKMVNSNNEDGVLTGNWTGNYKDGTSPMVWVGSPRILKQFMQTGSVKYGQCWVFSCVTTTVCRCLGIPCRTVTNFSSAHDTDQTNVIENVYHTVDGTSKKHYNHSDSIWNFHVWNEVWLKRPDLIEGYDGWQVIDATPQENSDGVKVCGPCPVLAVKKGMVELKYDTAFVFTEVNADEATFFRHPDDTYERQKVEKNTIGKFISTKVADGKPYHDRSFSFDNKPLSERKRMDLTDAYKFPEGSHEERRAVERAIKMRVRNVPELDVYAPDPISGKVEVTLHCNNGCLIGEDLNIKIEGRNVGNSARDLKILVWVSPVSYTGDVGPEIFSKVYEDLHVGVDEVLSLDLSYTASEYFTHLIEQANLEINVITDVDPLGDSTNHQYVTLNKKFRFRRPDLDVEGPETVEIGVPVDFTISFKNPAPITLKNCTVRMGSSGFTDIKDLKVPDVPVGETFSHTLQLIPKKKLDHEVIFSFECDELHDISGGTLITIC
ncbi:Transglutaminase 1 [Mactra antiquata]